MGKGEKEEEECGFPVTQLTVSQGAQKDWGVGRARRLKDTNWLRVFPPLGLSFSIWKIRGILEMTHSWHA